MYAISLEETINRNGRSPIILLIWEMKNCERFLILIHHVAKKCVIVAGDGLAARDPQPLCPLGTFAWPGHVLLLESVHVFSPFLGGHQGSSSS